MPSETRALADLSLNVGHREIVAILGPSGCGKTTLLRLAAGLEQPSDGSVLAAGQPVAGPSPTRTMVFQVPCLYPWQTVWENVSFGLALQGVSRQDRHDSARGMLAKFGLAPVMGQLPHTLSLGMQQRAAIARALLMQPALLILDEPFAALDVLMRQRMLRYLLETVRETNGAVLLATHDIDEALALADRILVMTARPGRIRTELRIDEERPRDLNAPALLAARRHLTGVIGDEADRAFLEQEA
ncbi:ABC transporter ATP-binding protein [Sedimentitalea sp. JM2-8]|uniref:ABC transporter ATP-binding protein n=1 Tax=Sedimentitalea xiamensis TaxID=3050037 RepID=A0ABT7FIA2_9RHOB|nr:ABC transporter ATP-binding protein [Sedimentitalea xiamensis]